MSGPGVIEALIAERWLKATLDGDAEMRQILGARDRIGKGSVPALAGNETVVFYSPQIPARDIRGVGLARIMAECLYEVRAVGLPRQYATVVAAAQRIDVLLHGARGPTVGGQVIVATREQTVQFTDPQGWEVLGGLYRLYAQ